MLWNTTERFWRAVCGTPQARFALEDIVGAGAILSHFAPDVRSPEAEVAVAAFQRLATDLLRYLQECASGREFIGVGSGEDVVMAAELDVSNIVKEFANGAYSLSSKSVRARLS